jgi:hypothetical protein
MSTSAPPTPKRIGRLSVSLACCITGNGVRLEGTVVDISSQGLGIKSNTEKFNLAASHYVVVDELGVFDVKVRWSRGDRIGVKFSDGAIANTCVQEYLIANGLTLT